MASATPSQAPTAAINAEAIVKSGSKPTGTPGW